MSKFLEQIIGPRTPQVAPPSDPLRYRRPTILLIIAAVCLLVSIFLPYWKMTLDAPQYPGGLSVIAYVNRLEGDVHEIDGLNHYIGMRPLGEAAQLERSLSIAIITVLSLLIISSIFIHTKFAAVLALPALLYPFIFLGDMYYWMRNFGLNLDPTAALSGAIDPFVPPILGVGTVAQFKTIATVLIGFDLALVGSVLIFIGLYYHRKAYKPLVDEMQERQD